MTKINLQTQYEDLLKEIDYLADDKVLPQQNFF